ncbi:hypothetical protein [Pseudoflavonifractor phocaeensis]|uniref:hypothetical protein n=1 Tax=Pseudoflavonifractor phocaeensis TaxID=1870988 RepID=UPI001959ADA9|nr:hypothetical protein [Pseudoflavonifractor phocaeensis]MBM6721938.1 hypothetical protein [Pseudoflavonifractor phocaeensis]
MSKFRISEVMDNYINNTLKEEAEKQRQLDAFVRRMTSRSPDVADQYKATPQPGHGPGTYQPRAIATSRDLISLHIPATSFDGSWSGFAQARDKAIAWLRHNRSQVINGCMCLGAGFDLDPEPLAFRDDKAQLWYNCAIDTEADFWLARLHTTRE